MAEAGSLTDIGRVYRSIGEPRKSIEYLDQSLVVLKGVNSSNQWPGHIILQAYTDLSRRSDPTKRGPTGLEIPSRSHKHTSTIRELARAESGRGNLETALVESEAALNLIELLRSRRWTRRSRYPPGFRPGLF